MIQFFSDNIIAVSAVLVTFVLVYHYVVERGSGKRLSKRYRNSLFEAQSKIFLNATQYLISGNKDLAIKEFLNAVDLNRETLETYFALGGLFRSNGDIEKAISIHRSLIARENISEMTRLMSLKELALDFDKAGLLDKAIETYKDVLEINRDQAEVILGLCKIYENIQDWDEAYKYRLMLARVGHESQAETISHVLVSKAKIHFAQGDFLKCDDVLEDALRYAPSVSAKILKLKLYLVYGNIDTAKGLFLELLKEHPMFVSFIFVSLEERFSSSEKISNDYERGLKILREFFLKMEDRELDLIPSVVLAKVRLFKELSMGEEALELLDNWMHLGQKASDVLKVEYIKLLVDLGKKDEALKMALELVENLNQTLARHFCSQCGYNSDSIFWHCPQCQKWETIQFRFKV